MKIFRRKLLVNPRLQYMMIVYSLTVSWCSIFVFYILNKLLEYVRYPVEFEDSMLRYYIVFLIFSFVTLAICVMSAAVFSNRVAGPIYRMRVDLDKITSGQKPFKIVIRKDDYHADLVVSVNRLLELYEKSGAVGTIHPDFAGTVPLDVKKDPV